MRVSQLFFVSPKDLAGFEPEGGWDLQFQQEWSGENSISVFSVC